MRAVSISPSRMQFLSPLYLSGVGLGSEESKDARLKDSDGPHGDDGGLLRYST